MLTKIIDFFTGNHRRLEDQVEHLRTMLISDNHWMSHSFIVRTLTNRYIQALGDNWNNRSFPPSHKLRESLRLDPNVRRVTTIDIIGRYILSNDKEIDELCKRYEANEITLEEHDAAKHDCEIRLQLLDEIRKDILEND